MWACGQRDYVRASLTVSLGSSHVAERVFTEVISAKINKSESMPHLNLKKESNICLQRVLKLRRRHFGGPRNSTLTPRPKMLQWPKSRSHFGAFSQILTFPAESEAQTWCVLRASSSFLLRCLQRAYHACYRSTILEYVYTRNQHAAAKRTQKVRQLGILGGKWRVPPQARLSPAQSSLLACTTQRLGLPDAEI
jgi:hypothetical protein